MIIITLLVIGTGGKKYHGDEDEKLVLHNMKENESDLLFHSPNLGTCHIIVTQKRLKLVCYNEELKDTEQKVKRKLAYTHRHNKEEFYKGIQFDLKCMYNRNNTMKSHHATSQNCFEHY